MLLYLWTNGITSGATQVPSWLVIRGLVSIYMISFIFCWSQQLSREILVPLLSFSPTSLGAKENNFEPRPGNPLSPFRFKWLITNFEGEISAICLEWRVMHGHCLMYQQILTSRIVSLLVHTLPFSWYLRARRMTTATRTTRSKSELCTILWITGPLMRSGLGSCISLSWITCPSLILLPGRRYALLVQWTKKRYMIISRNMGHQQEPCMSYTTVILRRNGWMRILI